MLEATSEPRIIGADSQGERLFPLRRLRRDLFCCCEEGLPSPTLPPLPLMPFSSGWASPLKMEARRLLFLFSAATAAAAAAVLFAPFQGPLEAEPAKAEENMPLGVSEGVGLFP